MSGAGLIRQIAPAILAATKGVLALLLCAGAALAHDAATGGQSGCALSERSPPRAVVRVIDGATLLLDDGSRVRLIGALAPNALDALAASREDGPPLKMERDNGAADADAVAWPPAAAAQHALAGLVEGRSVQLATSGRAKDRYGTQLAHAFAIGGTTAAVWLQGALLAAGHARAYGIPDNYGCMEALVAAEAPARANHLGLWSNPAYAVRQAWQTRELAALRGTFQIVEGRIVSARRVKSGWIYLNFGKDWRSDFSASIPPRVSRAHPAWAAGVLGEEGGLVRVRGFLDWRNGPSIEIEHAGQIEIVRSAERSPDAADPPAAPAAKR